MNTTLQSVEVSLTAKTPNQGGGLLGPQKTPQHFWLKLGPQNPNFWKISH